ncbi:MAG: hypothetical protein ABIP48_24465 [Planctomycetota bacterium]
MKKSMSFVLAVGLCVLLASDAAWARAPRGGRAGGRGISAPSRNFSPGPGGRNTPLENGTRPGMGNLGNSHVKPPLNNGPPLKNHLPPGGLGTPPSGNRPDLDRIKNHIGNFPERPATNGIRNGFDGQKINRQELQAQWRQQADEVRQTLQGRYDDLFTPQWYVDHPAAWHATHPYANAWAAVAWGTVYAWVGVAPAPVAYDYGSTLVYEGDTIYVEGEAAGSAEQYAQQASELAEAGWETDGANGEWLPLGVFALTPGKQAEANVLLQLATNREGIIRGTYYDLLSENGQPVQGSVDKRTQRVAWRVASAKTAVMETGLSSLTENEAPLLVHLSDGRIQNWLMVRVEK